MRRGWLQCLYGTWAADTVSAVPIDNDSERALVLMALDARRRRLDKPTRIVLDEARELARADLLASLMREEPNNGKES